MRADAVVVGAGAAGSLLAARLAASGRRVVILEGGPGWRLEDLASSQVWARRLKWGGAPVEHAGTAAFGHNMATGWGTGGSALHHYAGWPRLHPEDFTAYSLYGQGRDWPIEYDTLRPWYDRVQAECGVSGDAALEVWRPPGDPYPMPPMPVYRQGELLAAGFRKLGMEVAPAPLAINSIAYRGRAACVNDGWCDAGCPIGALVNPLVLHLPAARRAGAQLRPRAAVTGIELDRRGHARGVHWRDAAGEAHRVLAPLVVLAAGPVQNARLLLASAQTAAAGGVGNGSAQVGRGFVCHNVVAVFGLFEEPTENHLGVTAGSLISQSGYRKNARPGAFGSYQWGIGPALKPNDLLGIALSRAELFGTRLEAFMRTATRQLATMSALCETQPTDGNRIELGAARDTYGMPLARIVRDSEPQGLALAGHAAREGLRVLEAAGAHERWRGAIATSHPLGGTIMGDDPARSVTDTFGRVHDVPGLVIAGGGLFPSAGGGSPTFTILALAERAAAELIGH